MSDRVVVMNSGVIEQIGAPKEIYNKPASVFVANFIGQVNIIKGSVTAQKANVATLNYHGLSISGLHSDKLPKGTNAHLAVRPEDITISSKAKAGSYNSLKGVVSNALFSGNVIKISVNLKNGDVIKVESQPKTNVHEVGDTVHINWQPKDCNILLT